MTKKVCVKYKYVDDSIGNIIETLNKEDYYTYLSCSGLREEHEHKERVNPFLCFYNKTIFNEPNPPIIDKKYRKNIKNKILNSGWNIYYIQEYNYYTDKVEDKVCGMVNIDLSDDEIKNKWKDLFKSFV